MKRVRTTAIASLLLLLALTPIAAQDGPNTAQENTSSAAGTAEASAEERIRRLENDLRRYKENFEELDTLFRELVAVTQKLLAEGDELAGEVRQFLLKNEELRVEVDRTLEESRAIIDFLKNKVYERPTLLLEAELAWHVLLGEALAFSIVWEPLPWLGFRAGAELWYTDAFRPAFPVAVRLRFGLD